MNAPPPLNAARRRLMQRGAALAGVTLVGMGLAPALGARLGGAASPQPAAGETALGAWIRITPAGETVLVVSQAEIGQGISTTLPAILADELGADWNRVRLVTAPVAPAYRHPKYDWMFTGNSESVQSFYPHLRKMGAAAREMLTTAAARRWGVATETCRATGGFVIHGPSGRRLGFGALAPDAAALPVPKEPRLRPDRELKLVGRSLPRVDAPDKVTGRAVFGIDFQRPGMLVAAVRTVPAIGAKLVSFDAEAARAMPGVRAVLPLPDGVAVVAQKYWQAAQALRRITLHSEPTEASRGADSAVIEAGLDAALATGPWARVVDEGRVDDASGEGAQVVAVYANPFAAHATMEPMNCVADVRADRCEIWAPTQGQDLARLALQAALGLPIERIFVNRTPAIGGGFGRRLVPDFVVQAALVSKAAGAPVKVIWDREEDMRRDLFRPATRVQLAARVDGEGLPRELQAKVVSPTILLPVFPPIQKTLDEQRFDPSAMEGLMHVPYRLAARSVDFHLPRIPVPTSVMRTTGYGPNVFALESFIDELALRARQDPLAFRRRLLAHDPHATRLLDRLAALSRWDRPLPAGQGRGVAFAEAFGTLIGMVVQLQLKDRGVRLQRVSAVVDCGPVLDPGIARAGIEGGIVFGMAYCKTEVTFDQGRLREDNLARYALPTLAETPEMAIEFMDHSDRPLGGVGEVSPVTLPPALANALVAAGGARLRSLPLGRHDLHFA
ncbi:MAG TPA: molybdopterin cofactor-binding domain-containing protein [Albitalea sp.]|uniref:xanthine dehydrogenase family protein molybdopterin-binding subunit n=1 Tax=Piscinibacter sp. TaxID=1903157 RepID=UPI002ED14140